MKIDLTSIKTKILEETKEERDKISDINAKYRKMYDEEGKRRKRITYYVCLIVLICIFPVVVGWISWYLIPISIAMLLLGFAFADHKFMQYCSDEILKEGKNLASLEKLASEKKDRILNTDQNMNRYLRYLEEETMKAVLDDYDYYSAGTNERQRNENQRERSRLIGKIQSSFPGQMILLSFTSSFQDLKFEFAREFSFKWGPGLDHTKICKVNMHEDWETISFRSYSYYPSYL